MCHESVTIALCAPVNPPHRSFTCGKLHLIAEDRTICNGAQGKCVCYIGTCGTVERTFPTSAVDFPSLSKVRCSHCTSEEDAGNPRALKDITESPLLHHAPIRQDELSLKQHFTTLKVLWGREPSCPYHDGSETNEEVPVVSVPELSSSAVSISSKDAADAGQDEPIGQNEEVTVSASAGSQVSHSAPESDQQRQSVADETEVAAEPSRKIPGHVHFRLPEDHPQRQAVTTLAVSAMAFLSGGN